MIGDRPHRVIISGSLAASEVRYLQDCVEKLGRCRVEGGVIHFPY
jgi:hypothetical protein